MKVMIFKASTITFFYAKKKYCVNVSYKSKIVTQYGEMFIYRRRGLSISRLPSLEQMSVY